MTFDLGYLAGLLLQTAVLAVGLARLYFGLAERITRLETRVELLIESHRMVGEVETVER